MPGSSFRPGATRTNGVEKIERCRCIGSVAIVICPPASTSRADERNVGKEIERSATSIAAPLRCSPAAVAEQTERNRRPHIKSVKSPLLRCRHCYFPGGVDHTGQDPSRTKSLHGAPVWHCCPGYFPGRSDHVGGENTDDCRQTGAGATSTVRPRLTSRETWSPGRKKRPRARNTRTKRHLGAVACDIRPVVLFHWGGSQIGGGDVIGQPCHLGRFFLVFAPPESTFRDEKTPRMAEKSDERPR